MEKLQSLDILPAQMDSFQSKMQAVFSQFCDSYRADLQASFKQIYELLHQRYNLEESDDGARTETSFVATAHEIVYDSSNYGLESKFGGMGVNNKIVEPNEAWTIVKPSMTLDMTPFIFAPTALLMVEQASENHSESNQQLCVKEIGLGLSENGLINIIGSAAMVVEEAIPRVKMKSLIFESKLHKITNQNTARICNYGILGRVKFRMNMHLKNNLWQFMEGFGFQILQQSSDALLFPNLGIQAYIDALAAAGVIDKFEIHQE